MKNRLKHIAIFKYMAVLRRTLGINPPFWRRLPLFLSFLNDFGRYQSLGRNSDFIADRSDLYPRLFDRTTETKIDPVYFLQGTWCARKIFESKPSRHYDIGSQALMVGIVSQFVPTTMVDIRPLSISLPGLSFVKGDLTSLPFKEDSIDSLSSICVIEHVGLGRYGDRLDQFGTEKAAAELARVLAPGGNLYISVPVDCKNKVYFNAHRALTRDYVLKIFRRLNLKEEKYVYGNELTANYDPAKSFGTGFYHFVKRTTVDRHSKR